ncbi:MAG: radical SAM protein [Desulfobacteraceae bacterium]|nr:radical SAM protein [Desulfobacteraceae bacterium]
MSVRGTRNREENAASEIGAVKKRWNQRIRIALVYPNHYSVGMANLGFQAVYRLFNQMDGVVCERAFLPDAAHGASTSIRTVESGSGLRAFDIVAFSVSFENDYLNVVHILHTAGLPPRAGDRVPPHPLVVAGGVACFLNPEPLAPFIDAFLIGEAEALLDGFFRGYDPSLDREKLLLRLAADVPGVYVPRYYRPTYHADGTLRSFRTVEEVPPVVQRQFPADLSNLPTCTAVISGRTSFESSFLIEVARGCPHGCRFCSAGFVYRPPRFRPTALLQSCIEEGAARTDRIGLVGTAVSDLPEIDALCRVAETRKARVSFSSLRTDALDAEMVNVLRDNRVKTATIAPDAGSERMRRIINKGITEEQVLQAVERLVEGGIPNVRMYFMVGLPGERAEDVEAIVELCRAVKERFLSRSRPKGRIGTIQVSLNAFVPKPFTPFQWAAMDSVPMLKRKIQTVREGLRRVANLRVKSDPVRRDVIQALLSRGDRRVSELIAAAHHAGGNWTPVLKSHRDRIRHVVNRRRPDPERFPWDFIDHGVSKAFLLKEYHRAMAEKTSPPCPMDTDGCTRCGVCRRDITEGRRTKGHASS